MKIRPSDLAGYAPSPTARVRSHRIHASACCFLVCCLAWSPLAAQSTTPAPSAWDSQENQPLLGEKELRELLGPIALYPDALIAIILPAATVPSDVVLGARYLESEGDPQKADAQPWDESIKSLIRYPELVAWLDENLAWTASVGEAFVAQPADVMNVIQSLRAEAIVLGHLVDTPEQTVVVEDEVTRILPTRPEIIYVPQYNPEVVFVRSYSVAPVITFGVGFSVGSWLRWDFDWRNRSLYRGDWVGWNSSRRIGWGGYPWRSSGYRRGYRGNSINTSHNIFNIQSNVNVVNIDVLGATRWSPSRQSRREFSRRIQNGTGNARFRAPQQGLARQNSVSISQGAGISVNSRRNTIADRTQSRVPRPARFSRGNRNFQHRLQRERNDVVRPPANLFQDNQAHQQRSRLRNVAPQNQQLTPTQPQASNPRAQRREPRQRSRPQSVAPQVQQLTPSQPKTSNPRAQRREPRQRSRPKAAPQVQQLTPAQPQASDPRAQRREPRQRSRPQSVAPQVQQLTPTQPQASDPRAQRREPRQRSRPQSVAPQVQQLTPSQPKTSNPRTQRRESRQRSRPQSVAPQVQQFNPSQPKTSNPRAQRMEPRQRSRPKAAAPQVQQLTPSQPKSSNPRTQRMEPRQRSRPKAAAPQVQQFNPSQPKTSNPRAQRMEPRQRSQPKAAAPQVQQFNPSQPKTSNPRAQRMEPRQRSQSKAAPQVQQLTPAQPK